MFSPYPTPHEGAPVIREGGRFVRDAPANLRREDAELFAHEREREIPPTRLLGLRGVSATPEGVLFKGASILPESFSSPVIMRYFLGRRRSVLKFFVRNRLLRRRRRIEGPRLWVTDDWSGGYFHWLADALPRLYAARDAARETTLLLPHGYERLGFVNSSLKLFQLRGVEYVGADEVCVCDRLLMPTHTAPSGHYNEPLMRELRDFILDACGASSSEARARLYVSRARAPKRRLTNEAEVARVAEEFGFRVVYFEEHTFEEQVRLTASARHLVSNHGAGLTNILFMRAGGGVLELRREGERERNWFYNLASAAGLRYHYQLCAPADGDAHSGDLTADPGRLRENLALMLGRDG
jgi:capsular polysaccharide biosynthesis protein